MQIELRELGEQNLLGFGVVWENYGCDAMPGLKDGTVGYHIRDGKIFGADNSPTEKRIEGIYYHILDFVGISFLAMHLSMWEKCKTVGSLVTNKAILHCQMPKHRDFLARFQTLYWIESHGRRSFTSTEPI